MVILLMIFSLMISLLTLIY